LQHPNETYFSDLKHLIDLERDADRLQWDNLNAHASIQDLVLSGGLWHPVSIKSQDIDAAEYLTVEFERHRFTDIPSLFRTGGKVAMVRFTEGKKEILEGQVKFADQRKVRVKFMTDQLPHWSSLGKLGIQYIFDEYTYSQMQLAIKKADKLASEDDLIKILIGDQKIKPAENEGISQRKNLNAIQNKAIDLMLGSEKLAILHGPPGTGKTTTLVEAIAELSKTKKVLVCAASNAAVDLLAEKLELKSVNILRLGNAAKVKDQNVELTLQAKIAAHPDYKNIKNLKKTVAEYKNLAHKYKRNFGKAERDQRKALFNEAFKIQDEIEKLEKYILEDIKTKTNVHAATLIGSNQYPFQDETYDVLVIDEAAQAMEPACWVAILKTKKIILAGDHQQLPPTIKNQKSQANGLENTLFQKLILKYPEASIMLETQYRSNEKIMAFSSDYFYGSKLLAAESVKNSLLHKNALPIQFIDSAGSGFDEKEDGSSYTNPGEAAYLLRYISEFLSKNEIKINTSISIISPYRSQIQLIESLLPGYEELEKRKNYVQANSVDSFQGQESDIVLISLVRSNDKGEIGFLADIRRMNVALTRAKTMLVAMGDSGTIAQHKFYDGFVQKMQSLETYFSCYEFPECMP
jgi:ATP-dependent RNA/DNA helicase IGHMBP2